MLMTVHTDLKRTVSVGRYTKKEKKKREKVNKILDIPDPIHKIY